MAAGAPGDQKESLIDWFTSKMMHNALWEGDEEAGYEPFFKKAETAREDLQRKAYEEEAKNGGK